MFLFRWIRRLISLVILIALVLPSYGAYKVFQAAHNPVTRNADVIVVLGTAQFDGRPSEPLLARLEEAKRIFKLGLAPTIITVGAGAPGDRTTEAAAGRAWLQSEGISSKKITAVEIGRDTLSSTKAYIKVMQKRMVSDVIIVTDPYHCARAITMANDNHVIATCSPVTTGPNSLSNSSYKYLLREAGAYIVYITLGRRGIQISDHLPNSAIVTKVLG